MPVKLGKIGTHRSFSAAFAPASSATAGAARAFNPEPSATARPARDSPFIKRRMVHYDRLLWSVYSSWHQLLPQTARCAPQVLVGEGVAQRAFVRTPAAGRNGAGPKSRRKCSRRKELENRARSARWAKEFRPRKKVFREGPTDASRVSLPWECGAGRDTRCPLPLPWRSVA